MSKRRAPGDDGDLVQGVAVLGVVGHQGVPPLVVGRHAIHFLVSNARFLLRAWVNFFIILLLSLVFISLISYLLLLLSLLLLSLVFISLVFLFISLISYLLLSLVFISLVFIIPHIYIILLLFYYYPSW